MNRIIYCIAACLVLATVSSCDKGCNCPEPEKDGVKIIAHRGYWDTEKSAENSIASLKAAQQNCLYGSEFDVRMTKDGELIVFHDSEVDGKIIAECPYSELLNHKLPNGEKIPTLKQYVKQAGKCHTTRMVMELKSHINVETQTKAVTLLIEFIKKEKIADRIDFISFSYLSCLMIARAFPEMSVSYLSGNMTPEDLHKKGINGIDYQYVSIQKHPEWVKEAHDLGMTVNVWTIDDPELMSEMIGRGVDFITTNKPELAKKVIEEYRNMPVQQDSTLTDQSDSTKSNL